MDSRPTVTFYIVEYTVTAIHTVSNRKFLVAETHSICDISVYPTGLKGLECIHTDSEKQRHHRGEDNSETGINYSGGL